MDLDPRTRAACVHDTKTHFSQYLEEMRRGDYDRLIVRRYQKPVALLMTITSINRSAEERAARDMAALESRVAEQRRIAQARVLSCPAHQKNAD